jgi:hypothetical protein
MRDIAKTFFQAVVGDDGAEALAKAAERNPSFGSAILPRGILAWVEFVGRNPYSGIVPGVPGSYVAFAKSEDGLYRGTVQIDGQAFDFSNAQTLQLAATIGVALGLDQAIKFNHTDLTKSLMSSIGECLDVMVKSKVVYDLKKSDSPGAPTKTTFGKPSQQQGPATPSTGTKPPPAGKNAVAKPGKKKTVMDVLKGPKTTVLKMSEAYTRCSTCDAAQFEDSQLTFCHCLRDLRKYATAKSTGDGFEIQFGEEWSNADIQVFLDITGVKYG